jgi:hypothetical protein
MKDEGGGMKECEEGSNLKKVAGLFYAEPPSDPPFFKGGRSDEEPAKAGATSALPRLW